MSLDLFWGIVQTVIHVHMQQHNAHLINNYNNSV